MVFNLLDEYKVCSAANGQAIPLDGGSWTGPAVFGPLTGDNPQLDSNGVAPGDYVFSYSGGTGTCADNSNFTVTVRPPPEAGTSTTIELCVGDPDSNVLQDLGFPPPGGTFSEGTGVFSPVAAGSYPITYTVTDVQPTGPVCDVGGGCPDATATVTYNVSPLFNAGDGGQISICG